MIHHEGIIEIDGINISEIGLYDLRSNLAIIPQGKLKYYFNYIFFFFYLFIYHFYLSFLFS
jgi:ABC-type bacteriocin/lantibiotic exporter with double-glycine peptidase domain